MKTAPKPASRTWRLASYQPSVPTPRPDRRALPEVTPEPEDRRRASSLRRG